MLQRSDSEAEVERHMPPAAQAGDLASARLLILVNLRCSEVKPLVMKKEKKRASVTKPRGKVGFCQPAHRYLVFEFSFFDFSGVSSVSTMAGQEGHREEEGRVQSKHAVWIDTMVENMFSV